MILVTGAGSGIGRATALRAAELGLAVAAWDLNGDTVAATAAQINADGGTALALACDVGDAGQVDAAFVRSRELGTIRHLANVAGPPLRWRWSSRRRWCCAWAACGEWWTYGCPAARPRERRW
ncbi:SDR family NAD(P)-dependent oxidoreductase [Dactylosporangium cerinum]